VKRRPQSLSPGVRPRPGDLGIDARDLDDPTLLRYLGNLHRTRLDALRHASHQALVTHMARTGELEVEYLARRPAREVYQPGAYR
jgi:hypothetical protein